MALRLFFSLSMVFAVSGLGTSVLANTPGGEVINPSRGVCAPPALNRANATTFDGVTAHNLNLVSDVPLCAATNTRAATSVVETNGTLTTTASQARALSADDLRSILTLLNNPASFEAAGSAAGSVFEPHVAFVFRNQTGQVVMHLEVSTLTGQMQGSPRLPGYANTGKLTAQSRNTLAGICQRAGLVTVDQAYVARYQPARLTSTQQSAISAYSTAPSPNMNLLANPGNNSNGSNTTVVEEDEFGTDELLSDADFADVSEVEAGDFEEEESLFETPETAEEDNLLAEDTTMEEDSFDTDFAETEEAFSDEDLGDFDEEDFDF